MTYPAIVASTIMDGAAALLNDTGRNLYTNTVQIPYLKRANKNLEQLLTVYGISAVREVTSTPIDVAANATILTLPDDFLLPIQLFERADDSTSDDEWVEMLEVEWEENRAVATTLEVWVFRESGIKFVGASTAREVKMRYERMLAPITGDNSPIEDYKIEPWLEAKTAELCARFIGMNKTMADEIANTELALAEDNLIRAYVLNQQGIRHRRQQYTSKMGIIR